MAKKRQKSSFNSSSDQHMSYAHINCMNINSDYFTSCAFNYDLDIGGNIIFITIVTILYNLDTAVYLRTPSRTHANKSIMGILE